MKMQDKIVAAIRKIATDHKLETAETWAFSNVGDFHFQRPGHFDTLFMVDVSFQDAYLSGTIVRPGEQGAVHQIERKRQFPYTEYIKPGQVQHFIDAVTAEAKRFGEKWT